MRRPILVPTLLSFAFGLPLSTVGCDDGGTSATKDTASDTTSNLHLEAAFEVGPNVGQNELHIHLHDANDVGIAGATITVVPTMPMMGHGSTETPVVTEAEDAGHYHAFPVTLQMPGAWHIEVTATVGSDTTTTSLDVTAQ